jgi:hypothetical protein
MEMILYLAQSLLQPVVVVAVQLIVLMETLVVLVEVVVLMRRLLLVRAVLEIPLTHLQVKEIMVEMV